jgi:glycine cleavage system H protein
MSNTPDNLRYAPSHEWVRVDEDGTATIGITEHAVSQLGDLVFVELPEAPCTVSAGDEIVVVESVKTASDVYTPVSGDVLEINAALEAEPGTVNSAPYAEGWLYRIKMSHPDELSTLMDAQAYETQIASE